MAAGAEIEINGGVGTLDVVKIATSGGTTIIGTSGDTTGLTLSGIEQVQGAATSATGKNTFTIYSFDSGDSLTVLGSSGNDVFNVADWDTKGTLTLTGGSGNDEFNVAAGAKLTITDTAGEADILNLTSSGTTTIGDSGINLTGVETINLYDGTNNITLGSFNGTVNGSIGTTSFKDTSNAGGYTFVGAASVAGGTNKATVDFGTMSTAGTASKLTVEDGTAEGDYKFTFATSAAASTSIEISDTDGKADTYEFFGGIFNSKTDTAGIVDALNEIKTKFEFNGTKMTIKGLDLGSSSNTGVVEFTLLTSGNIEVSTTTKNTISFGKNNNILGSIELDNLITNKDNIATKGFTYSGTTITVAS